MAGIVGHAEQRKQSEGRVGSEGVGSELPNRSAVSRARPGPGHCWPSLHLATNWPSVSIAASVDATRPDNGANVAASRGAEDVRPALGPGSG